MGLRQIVMAKWQMRLAGLARLDQLHKKAVPKQIGTASLCTNHWRVSLTVLMPMTVHGVHARKTDRQFFMIDLVTANREIEA